MADINDFGRAVSGEGAQEGETNGLADGEYIIFSSEEKLQSGAPAEVGTTSSGALFPVAQRERRGALDCRQRGDIVGELLRSPARTSSSRPNPSSLGRTKTTC